MVKNGNKKGCPWQPCPISPSPLASSSEMGAEKTANITVIYSMYLNFKFFFVL